jgi:hypothetical protein
LTSFVNVADEYPDMRFDQLIVVPQRQRLFSGSGAPGSGAGLLNMIVAGCADNRRRVDKRATSRR